METDGAGNSYVRFKYSGTIEFGGQMFTAHAGGDVLVAKISPTGALSWAHSCGGGVGIRPGAFGVSPTGDVVITGFTATSGPPFECGGASLSTGGQYADFGVRFKPDGSLAWGKIWLAELGVPNPLGLAFDANGAVVMAGFELQDLNFGMGSTGTTYGQRIVKLNADGSLLAQYDTTAHGAVATGTEAGHTVAVDAQGNILVGGNAAGQALLFDDTHPCAPAGSPATHGAFLAKLSSDLTSVAWTKCFGDSLSEVDSIASGPSGALFVTGSLSAMGNEMFDLGCGPFTPNTIGVFTAKLSDMGTGVGCSWSKQNTVSSQAYPASGALLQSGDFVVGGSWLGQLGPIGFGGATVTPPNAIGYNAFLFRLAGADGSQLGGESFGAKLTDVAARPDGALIVGGLYQSPFAIAGMTLMPANGSTNSVFVADVGAAP